MKETNWNNDLKAHKILLLIWVFTIDSLQFQVVDKWILTPLQLLDYKLIAVSIFEEFTLVESYKVRSLADSSNAYFS